MVKANPQPLYPQERDTVAIVEEAKWAPGPVWAGAENITPTSIRSPDRPAHSESLYRLRHRKIILLNRNEKVYEDVKGIQLAHNMFQSLFAVNTAMNLRVP